MKSPGRSNLKLIKNFIISIGFLGISLIINKFADHLKFQQRENKGETLKFWPFIVNTWNKNDNLRTMKRVFNRLQYEEVNGSQSDWDVLWSIEYPFELLRQSMLTLKSQQKVNHLPGISFITHKQFMTTRNKLKYIPPAFQFPPMFNEFKTYINDNPKKKFVVKNFDNRGVKMVEEIEIYYNDETTFIQEFVENPLLIDGRVFDLGVYVVISSINPLRIYRYKAEVLSRFCPEPYSLFDQQNVEKYVIYETQNSVWEMPSLSNYINKLGYSFKKSIEIHLKSRGYNISSMWEQIDDAIVSLILQNEKHFISESAIFGSSNYFFELLRFGFIIDADLNVHFMEVNMSPNLTPSKDRFEKNALSYEQVVYNTVKLVGLGSRVEMKPKSKEETNMISNIMDIATEAHFCSTTCYDSCMHTHCDLCLPCMSNEVINNLHRSYREHIQRGEMMRIFPSNIHCNDEFIQQMTTVNQFMIKWFRAKCYVDYSWC